MASKDSLFATEWPAWAWAANLGFLALLWWAHRTRVRRGHRPAEDEALVWGATALVALFLVTLPFVACEMSLAVQFQISRVFWLVDFLALVYVIAAVIEQMPARLEADASAATLDATRPRCAAAARDCHGRGAYVMLVERPDVRCSRCTCRSAWEDAMRLVARSRRDSHVLADPGHAMEVRHQRARLGRPRRAARRGEGFRAGNLFARRGGAGRRTARRHSAISAR